MPTLSAIYKKFTAPALPQPPAQYQAPYVDQFNRVLRLYFAQLDALLESLFTPNGGAVITVPYGSFSSSVSQSTTANTDTVVTLNTTDYSNAVSVQTTTKMTVTRPGIYRVQYSAQLQNTDTDGQDVSIWLRKNGTDVASSNSVFGMPSRKSPSEPAHTLGSFTYILSLLALEYIELVWSPTDAAASMTAYAAGTGPTIPATPSVIATMTFVSAL